MFVINRLETVGQRRFSYKECPGRLDHDKVIGPDDGGGHDDDERLGGDVVGQGVGR